MTEVGLKITILDDLPWEFIEPGCYVEGDFGYPWVEDPPVIMWKVPTLFIMGIFQGTFHIIMVVNSPFTVKGILAAPPKLPPQEIRPY